MAAQKICRLSKHPPIILHIMKMLRVCKSVVFVWVSEFCCWVVKLEQNWLNGLFWTQGPFHFHKIWYNIRSTRFLYFSVWLLLQIATEALTSSSWDSTTTSCSCVRVYFYLFSFSLPFLTVSKIPSMPWICNTSFFLCNGSHCRFYTILLCPPIWNNNRPFRFALGPIPFESNWQQPPWWSIFLQSKRSF